MAEGLAAKTLPGVAVLLLASQLSTVQAIADCAAITRPTRPPPASRTASLLNLNCFMRRDSLIFTFQLPNSKGADCLAVAAAEDRSDPVIRNHHRPGRA